MSKLTNSIIMDSLIDSYLKGEMMPNEEVMFFSQLKYNQAFRERAYLTAMVIESGNQQRKASKSKKK